MAIAVTALGSYSNTAAVTSAATGSYTAVANRVHVACVMSRRATSVSEPTGSGNSLTWTKFLARSMLLGGTPGYLTVFTARGAAPTDGAFTADWGAETEDGVGISVFGIDGLHATVPIVQSADAQASGTAMSVALSGTLAKNAVFGFFGIKSATAPSVGSGYTLIHGNGFATPNSTFLTQYFVGSDNAVDATAGASAEWGGIAFEVDVLASSGFGAGQQAQVQRASYYGLGLGVR